MYKGPVLFPILTQEGRGTIKLSPMVPMFRLEDYLGILKSNKPKKLDVADLDFLLDTHNNSEQSLYKAIILSRVPYYTHLSLGCLGYCFTSECNEKKTAKGRVE